MYFRCGQCGLSWLHWTDRARWTRRRRVRYLGPILSDGDTWAIYFMTEKAFQRDFPSCQGFLERFTEASMCRFWGLQPPRHPW
jgi:hypothetical protein